MSQFRKNSKIQYAVHKLYEKISCYVASCNVSRLDDASCNYFQTVARISLFFAPGVIFPASRKGYDSDYFYLSSQSYTFTKFDCSSKYSEVIIMYLLFFAFTLFSIRLTLKTKIVNLFKKGSMRDDNLPLQKISMHLLSESVRLWSFFQ